MSGPDVDDDLLVLSIVEPDAFVAARNARAKELRAAKERDRAGLVAKLAKPTWTAWALNVLARRHPDEIRTWLGAGDALDAALTGAMSGDREGVRDAQQEERATLARTVDRAAEVLVGAGRKADDQARQRLTGTLRAAVTDPEVRDRLLRGVLAEDVEAPSFGFGFGSAGGDNVVSLASARASRATERRGSATGASGRRNGVVADESAGTAARIEREEAEAREAAALAETRRRAEEERAAELARLEAEVERRTEELDRLRAVAVEAEAAAGAAREAADAADRALAEVRAALAELPPVDPG